MQFKFDVLRTAREISSAPGNTLITTPGRYAFSVALLASWLADRAVILPPDDHQMSWQKIRQQHNIGFECDSDFDVLLQNSGRTAEKSGSWSLSLTPLATAVKLYTSGSTGLPCIVNKSISNLMKEANCIAQSFDWSAQAIVGTVPAQHLYGLTFTILLPWVLAVPLVDEVPFYPRDIARVVSQSNAATLISVPAHYNVLLKNEFKAASLNCLSATAPLPQRTAKNWYRLNQKPILEIYGSTETGVIGFRRQSDDQNWVLFPGIKLSSKSKSLMLSSAFLHPDLGTEFQIADQLILTGENTFVLLGRKDAVIKIAGKRISLAEIEQALLECSGITDAAVLAVDVQGLARDKAIWAVVVAQTDCLDAVSALRLELAQKIEATRIPKRFLFVDKLPRNSSGKVPRQALEELFKNNVNSHV